MTENSPPVFLQGLPAGVCPVPCESRNRVQFRSHLKAKSSIFCAGSSGPRYYARASSQDSPTPREYSFQMGNITENHDEQHNTATGIAQTKQMGNTQQNDRTRPLHSCRAFPRPCQSSIRTHSHITCAIIFPFLVLVVVHGPRETKERAREKATPPCAKVV